MGPCHRNPQTRLFISSWCWAHGGCAVDAASLLVGPPPSAAVPARLRLLVVPCLNARKRHVRGPPPFPITLLPSFVPEETTYGERPFFDGHGAFYLEQRLHREHGTAALPGAHICRAHFEHALKVAFR